MKALKLNIIIALLLTCNISFAQEERTYTSEEKETVKEFKEAVENARDRVDLLQDRSPLHGKKYIEEEKVVREAEQMAALLDDGHYIEPAKLKNWNKRLEDLGDAYLSADKKRKRSKNVDESMRRHGKTMDKGKEAVLSGKERIDKARKALEKQKQQGAISEDDYEAKRKKIEQAEERIEKLEEKLAQESERVEELTKEIRNNPDR